MFTIFTTDRNLFNLFWFLPGKPRGPGDPATPGNPTSPSSPRTPSLPEQLIWWNCLTLLCHLNNHQLLFHTWLSGRSGRSSLTRWSLSVQLNKIIYIKKNHSKIFLIIIRTKIEWKKNTAGPDSPGIPTILKDWIEN